LENTFIDFAAFGHAEDFRKRPRRVVGLEALDGAGRENNHPMRRFAAHNFLPRICHNIELFPREVLREHGGCGVANCDGASI